MHFAMGNAAMSDDRECLLSKFSDEDLTIGTIAIADQIAGSLFPAAGFHDLI
jgi:hypothetical protein